MDAVSAYFIIAIPCFTLKSAPVWMINYIASVVMTQPFIFKKKMLKNFAKLIYFPFLDNPMRLLKCFGNRDYYYYFFFEGVLLRNEKREVCN